MTERLYYADPYLTHFSATVLACRPERNGYHVLLDRSAFYPTSGGQPYDTGTLGGRQVLDVSVDKGGEIWHLVDGPLEPDSPVEGHVDWPRRFDHMQQHAGEHMLAGVIWHMLRGHTIGLHLGAEDSTIDVELPDGSMRVEEDVLLEIEERVNRQIQQDLPIRCWFPTPDELEAAPLRKRPAVSDHIRLIQVGDVECVACGGTHPSSSGQIGLLKILDARPSRGKMRVRFVCGMRAFRQFQKSHALLDQAARVLSTAMENLPGAVKALNDRLHEAERALRAQRLSLALQDAPALMENALTLAAGSRLIAHVAEGLDRDGLVELARYLTGQGFITLLANAKEEGAALLFSAPEGTPADMGRLLSACVKPLGGKGGGKPDFAQGAGPGEQVLKAAMAHLTA